MKGKHEATENNMELNTTQPPVKCIHQTEPSTSSMTTDHQKKPLAELMATKAAIQYIKFIDPDDTDNEYLAEVLMNLFQHVYTDPMWKDALDNKYKDLQNCLAAIQANRLLAEECVKSMKPKDWEPVFVDELAKIVFTIPICLRGPNKTGEDDVESVRELLAIIYIDECHYLSLINVTIDGKECSLLDAMLHAIELCREDGLFRITLSTNSSFHSVSPHADEFKSKWEFKAQPPSNA
ncbi:hypothetical protein M0805_008641 [Coniferiporia weirii]|nr:hypothetical protein M0805_008641 [Coniferiporia weirii]